MLVKRFRETGPGIIILIFIVILFTWTSAFLNPHLPSDFSFDIKPMPLYGLLLDIAGFNPLFSVIVAFIIAGLVSFLLVTFNTNVFFISERNFLPALIYILLTGIFPAQHILNPVLPAAVFLIFGVQRIMYSYRVQGTAFSFFDAGMLISIGSLFYASFIWLGFLLIVGIAILRTVNIKEIIISVLGLATPVFVLYGFFYVTGKDMNSLWDAITYNLFTKDVDFSFSGLNIAVLILSGFVILISLAQLLSAINAKKIKSRKTFVLLFWTLLIIAAEYLIFKSVSVEIFWLAAIPPTYFLSHYFVFSRKKIVPEIMLSVLFILAAVLQIVNFVQ
jgi:hypothetical protein